MTEPTRSRAATEEVSGARRDRERPPAPEPLPHPVVDNHCHLDIADGDWVATTDAIAAAAAVGVPRIVQIGCDLPGARWAVAAAAEHDALVAGVALHPNEAPRLAATGDLEDALAEIERLAGAHDKVRAVGETGLDHFRTGRGRVGPRRRRASAATSTWPSASTRRSSSTTATPTTTCSASSTRRARPSAG